MTHKPKYLGSFAAFVAMMAVTVTCSAETITLALPEAEASAEGNVDVVLNVQGAKNLVAMQFVVVHDPAVLKVAQVEAGKLLEEATIESNFDNPGRLFFASASVTPVAENGELLRITYKVIGEVGKKSPLTIEKAEAWQANEMQILVETKPGSVTIGAATFPWIWALVAGFLTIVGSAIGVVLMRRRSHKTVVAPPPLPPQIRPSAEQQVRPNAQPATRRTAPAHVSRPPDDEEELVAVPESEPVRYRCEHCQRLIKVPPTLVGKKFRCPNCRTVQTTKPLVS